MFFLQSASDWIAPAIVLALVLLFQLRTRRPKTPLHEIRRLVQLEKAPLLDVRSAGEFASGALPGARNVPLDRLNRMVSDFDRNKAIVVYCQSGARSSFAAKFLKKAGFNQVHDLGAISNWQ